MVTSETAPLPSAIPKPPQREGHQLPSKSEDKPLPPTPPPPPHTIIPAPLPRPKLRFHVNNARHPASKCFLSLIPDLESTLETALATITQHLYTPNPKLNHLTFTPSVPPTRSVTVILRDFGGVAYTTGTELDDDHKEIHLSLSYIATSTEKGKSDPARELAGVLTHELVHGYQHTSPPSPEEGDGDGDGDGGEIDIPGPPGGLIEGIADFVRLKAGLVPPHWKRPGSAKDRAEKWDQGYQHTAFFLEWIEQVRVGTGAVGLMNDRLLRVGYIGETEDEVRDGVEGFWMGLFGTGVLKLWEQYGEYLDSLDGEGGCRRRSGNWEDEIVNP